MDSLTDHQAILHSSAPIKLSDFGLAVQLKPGEKLFESCGSPNYMAPERLTGEGYDEKSDIWSLGVLLYILIEGVFVCLCVCVRVCSCEHE